MKKLIYIISLVGILSLTNSCSSGYVSVEPSYQEYRPARPSNTHIWIEGNWYWDNRTRTYHHRDGNWTTPRNNHYYEPGHWIQTRRGYRWVDGRWR
jgi:hypothetical protein